MDRVIDGQTAMTTSYDVIIIGAGPAGLTAGLYTSRARLRTLVIDKGTIGGQLTNRDLIENYPGYPDGILGPELGSNMAMQVMNLGTQLQFDDVEGIEAEGKLRLVHTHQSHYSTRAIIIASGSSNKKLGVAGEDEFLDKGVFYCATCDGPHFTDKVVAVAGGGNSGVTEALFLSKFVSKVILIELMPCLTADKILQERLSNKVEIKCGVRIEAIRGDKQVKALDLVDAKTGQKSVLDVDGILVHIGVSANTGYLKGKVQLDNRGQVLVNEKMGTNVPGIFAAGDVRHNSPMQIATAVGDGAIAALSAEEYLSEP